MAYGCATLDNPKGGQASTPNASNLGLGYRTVILIVRAHYLFLAPWIIFSIHFILEFGIILASFIGLLGLLGMFAKKFRFATIASLALLSLLVFGKVGSDLLGEASPDTAVLLIQFVAVISLMEASRVVLSFDAATSELVGKTDDVAIAMRKRLDMWVKDQLAGQARLILGALGLSLFLLVLGGFASVSFNQLFFSAALTLLVVGALVFLITQRREPETKLEHLR